jgi:hypothetical protein
LLYFAMAPGFAAVGVLLVIGAAIIVGALLFINSFVERVVRVSLNPNEWCYVGKLFLRAHFAAALSAQRRLISRDISQPPQCGSDAITAPWLTSALRAAGLLKNGTVVSSVVMKEKLSENIVLHGVVLALDVRYGPTSADSCGQTADVAKRASSDGASDDRPSGLNPPALLVKTVRYSSVEHRYDMLAAGNYREARYYGSDFERVGRFSGGVRVVYAHSSPVTAESVVVMQDLRSEERPRTLGLNFYCGNQVWGIPPEVKAAMAQRSPERLLRTFFERAADLHGAFWCDPSLKASRWLKAADWYRGENKAAWTLAVKGGALAWAKAKALRPASVMSPALIGIIDRSFACASWAGLQARLHDPSIPFALTHGDFHAANALWRPPARAAGAAEDASPGSLFLVDWSEAGVWEPLTDVGQAMISDVSVEVRRKHERALLRAYWERLTGGPATRATAAGLPFERCWELYARHSPERWIFMFALLASMPNLPDSATTYFHDQLLAFINDHAEHAPRKGGEIIYPMASVVTLGRAI